MAYLPQYQHDLFISYRRASNEGQDAWVDHFCDSVRSALKDLVGDVSIWRDTAELHAGDAWRPEIAQAVDSAGIFIALISRTYFDSDECRKEFDRFLGRIKGADGASRKLMPIYKHPPKPDQTLPAELAQIGHHEFFNLQPKPWRELDPRRDADDYQERLGRVVFDLMEALEALHGQQKQRALGKVFVASVGPELLQERERLRTDLRQRGWLVVPEREYLWNADDHAQRILDDLANAQLCVHLVQRVASVEPLTATRSRLQLELAHAQMQQRGRPAPLVWIQPLTKAEEASADSRALIEYIEGDLANEGVDYLQGSLEDLKTLVIDRLPAPPTAAPAAEPNASTEVRAVALLVEEADLPDTAALKLQLAGPLGMEPRPLKFAGSTPRDADRLARTLAACPQAIIVWSRQGEDWVYDLLDHPALAGHLGPQRLCVLAVGEPSDEKAAFSTRQARVVRATGAPGGDGLAEMRAFFASLPTGAP